MPSVQCTQRPPERAVALGQQRIQECAVAARLVTAECKVTRVAAGRGQQGSRNIKFVSGMKAGDDASGMVQRQRQRPQNGAAAADKQHCCGSLGVAGIREIHTRRPALRHNLCGNHLQEEERLIIVTPRMQAGCRAGQLARKGRRLRAGLTRTEREPQPLGSPAKQLPLGQSAAV